MPHATRRTNGGDTAGWLRHKTHHEHNHPSVLTNQHFTVPDLFVEAYLPVIIGMVTLRYGVGWACNPLEEALVSGYIGWQEQCSHSGKPVPFSESLTLATRLATP